MSPAEPEASLTDPGRRLMVKMLAVKLNRSSELKMKKSSIISCSLSQETGFKDQSRLKKKLQKKTQDFKYGGSCAADLINLLIN